MNGRHTAIVALLTTALSGAPACAAQQAPPREPAAPAAEPYTETLPGTLVTFAMVPVPGGTVTVDGRTVEVDPFFISRTEVTWDMYDVYMLRLDEASSTPEADAIARPSMPYAVPDYEWGHDGFAAISIASGAAVAFTEWLSVRTGHSYRLATEAEWQHAANLAAARLTGTDATNAAASPALDRATLDRIAWHAGNAGRQTHAVASREPDGLGLFDLFGNAAEWVTTLDGRLVTRGGSFRDDPANVGPHARAFQNATWTERDPQLPSSVWWLSDGPFVGFRLVRDP